MQESASRQIGRLLGTITCAGTLGAFPATSTAPTPAASQILARIAQRDAAIESYTVPVQIKVSIHKLFTFHIALGGTQKYLEPAAVTMDVRRIPVQGRKLFAEIGTPLTWPRQYDLRLVATNGAAGGYELEGVPKQPSDIVRMVVDAADQDGRLHARWWMRTGSTIDMLVTEQTISGYELPAHADAELTLKGMKIHAAIDYGAYTVNEAKVATRTGTSGAK